VTQPPPPTFRKTATTTADEKNQDDLTSGQRSLRPFSPGEVKRKKLKPSSRIDCQEEKLGVGVFHYLRGGGTGMGYWLLPEVCTF